MKTNRRFLRCTVLFALTVAVSLTSGCAGNRFNVAQLAFWRVPDTDATEEGGATQLAESNIDEAGDESDAQAIAQEPEAAVAQVEQDDEPVAPESEVAKQVASADFSSSQHTFASGPQASKQVVGWQQQQSTGYSQAFAPSDAGPVAPWNVDQPSYTLADRRASPAPMQATRLTAQPANHGQFQSGQPAGTSDSSWQGTNESASSYAQPIRGASFGQ